MYRNFKIAFMYSENKFEKIIENYNMYCKLATGESYYWTIRKCIIKIYTGINEFSVLFFQTYLHGSGYSFFFVQYTSFVLLVLLFVRYMYRNYTIIVLIRSVVFCSVRNYISNILNQRCQTQFWGSSNSTDIQCSKSVYINSISMKHPHITAELLASLSVIWLVIKSLSPIQKLHTLSQSGIQPATG